jgi:hypothetical protein
MKKKNYTVAMDVITAIARKILDYNCVKFGVSQPIILKKILPTSSGPKSRPRKKPARSRLQAVIC